MLRDKIVDILYDELYEKCCNTCTHKGGDIDSYGSYYHPCSDCREHANWQISNKCIEELANKLLNCMKG